MRKLVGNLIVLELDDSVLGKANLFDLTGHTLRFTRMVLDTV